VNASDLRQEQSSKTMRRLARLTEPADLVDVSRQLSLFSKLRSDEATPHTGRADG
jgi:hypothetical protein